MYVYILLLLYPETNVVFSLLNGEAFDYIGSSRMIYDMKQNHFDALGFNMKLDNIKSIIEFGQLGKGKIILHSNGEDPIIDRLQDALEANISNSIPPTSAQSFLNAKPNLTTVVITNHGEQFENRYYNGILDDAENLGFDRYNKVTFLICECTFRVLCIIEIFCISCFRNDTSTLASDLAKIALHVANELYQAVTDKQAPQLNDLPISLEKLITEMLHCYLESAKCPLFRAASAPGTKLVNQVLPLYVGVHRAGNVATTLTGQLLALLTGEILLEMNETACHENRLGWLAGYNFTGVCVNSSANYSTAVSPAFIIEGRLLR